MMSGKKAVPKLRFSGFEGDWEEKSLIEISTNGISNGVFNDPKKVGRGYKIINVSNMYDGSYINNSKLTLLELDEKIFLKNKAEYGDIFFTRSSLVASGIAYSNINLSKDDDITFDGHLMRIRPNTNISFPVYLSYYFRTEYARKQFVIRGKTTTMTTIGQDDIADVLVYLPPFVEQHKIAEFFSDIDGKIEKIARKKELTDQFKKGMMQKIFSQEIRFKDDSGKQFPEWEEKRLGDFLTYTPRKIDKPIDGYWRLGLRSHAKGTFHEYVNDPTKNSMDELFVIEDGDLIVNITFAWEHAVAIASCNDAGKLVSHRFPTYVIDPIFDKKFIHYLVTHKKFKYQLEGISPGGAGRNRVMSKKDFPEIIVTIPHPVEQQKIASFLTDIDIKITAIDRELSMLKEFKRGLLQQMFV